MTHSPALKHIPERTCVACRKKRPQSEFVRVTKGNSGWELRAGARVGRGAYVCANNPACWQEKKLRRAFAGQAHSVAAQLVEKQIPAPAQSNPAQSQPAQSKPVDQPMMT